MVQLDGNTHPKGLTPKNDQGKKGRVMSYFVSPDNALYMVDYTDLRLLLRSVGVRIPEGEGVPEDLVRSGYILSAAPLLFSKACPLPPAGEQLGPSPYTWSLTCTCS